MDDRDFADMEIQDDADEQERLRDLRSLSASEPSVKEYRKTATIKALQWTGQNLREIISFMDGDQDKNISSAPHRWDDYCDLVAREGLKIKTLEGWLPATTRDWIAKGVQGEHWAIKPDVFAATYALVTTDAPTPTVPTPLASQPAPGEVRKAFEEFARSRALSLDVEKDAWGDDKYKHSHVDAMWFGWLNASAHRTPVAPEMEGQRKESDTMQDVKQQMLDYYEGDTMCIAVNTVADLVNESEATISRLEREKDELKTALRVHSIHMEYDFPGDAPEPCGLFCELCKQHVEDDRIEGHKPSCLNARAALTAAAKEGSK